MKKLIIILLSFTSPAVCGDKSVIAEVNGYKITLKDVASRLLISNFDLALEELIEERMLLDEAKKRNITITNSEFEEFIKGIKKRFASEQDFKKVIKKIGLAESEYYEIIKNKLIAEKTIIALSNINVTDEDAKKYYEANLNQFKTPKLIKLRQIFVLNEKEAEDVKVALDAGADFIKLAGAKNADENLKKNSGDLGYISKGMLMPDIEKEVFDKDIKKYVGPIKTGNGYSFLFIEDIKPEKITPFEEIKDEIKNSLKLAIVNSKRKQIIEELKKVSKIVLK
ncbi:MAG: peptidyl-prolyl cis-trans isomerase [Elusimicrobiales bacterium]